jgi:PIN domain nuclease of toxin-antitoxin system
MTVILDTHAFVWLLNGDEQLGAQARAEIASAASENMVYVSAITSWEIAMLVSKGRLTLHKDVGEWLTQAFSLPGIRLEPLSVEIAVASTRLPGTPHGDPADRIIVATARYLGAQLVTADGPLLEYGVLGHVRTVKARA